ncbi:MAG: PorT family protein [Sphingobacteriaceae bacterium]|nr:PorT family protein [Sphingobacteriaceae bacterium]
MKRIFLLAAGFLIAGTVANAQTSTTTTTMGGTKFGLKAGVNLSKYSFGRDDANNLESDQLTNFHITGYADLPLGGMFSVQPGLSLQGKGGSFSNTFGTTKENVMWLEIPVNLVGKIPLGASGTSFFIGAGPYAGVAIAGENETTLAGSSNNSTSKIKFGDEAGDQVKMLDFGLNGLAGVQLANGFNLGAGYGFGLTDLFPSGNGGNGQKTNRVISFSLGYAF